MASGSNNLTTYYAKRIMGDNVAANEQYALLQTGENITNDAWILTQTERLATSLYGIKYLYDSVNANDKIELYGGQQNNNEYVPSAWIQLNNGNTYILGQVGINYDPNEDSNNPYQLYINGSTRIDECLHIFPTNNNYDAGIRIHSYNNWSTIVLCGEDNDNDTGTSTNSWLIGNNNGTFYITHNGSDSSTTGYLIASTENSAGYWQFQDRVGINGQSNTYNLYVDGNIKFDIGTSDGSNIKRFIVYGNNRYLSFGGAGIQAYNSSNTASPFYLNWYGSSIEMLNNDNASTSYVLIRSTLDASSTSTGALRVSGGFGLASDAYIGGHIYLSADKDIFMKYGNVYYDVISNYNNGNVVMTACSGALYIGYKNTQDTYIYYSTSSSAGTKFFEVNSDGSYALTRFGVNGQNTSYNLYISGTTYGTNTITTHTDFKTDRTGYGLYLIDKASTEYAGIRDNGSNLWIGAASSTSQHHKGSLFLSAGHNGTTGNKSIYISIPANGNSTTTDTEYALVYQDATGTQYKGIYTDGNGKTVAMTYELKATVNAGTSGHTAYYSSANAVSSYNNHWVNATSIHFKSNAFARTTTVSSNSEGAIWIRGNGDGDSTDYIGSFGWYRWTSNNTGIYMRIWGQDANDGRFWYIRTNANIGYITWTGARVDNAILPLTTNKYELGSSSLGWKNLYISGANNGIYFTGSKSTERMVRFLDNTAGTDGNGMIIGGAGYMGIGSGESADQSYSGAGYSAGSEVLVLSSDGDIRLLPNQQNGYNVVSETLITTSGLWVGVAGNTTREMDIGVRSGAGTMYMYAVASATGNRGIWVPAHGTGGAKDVFKVDTNNAVTFNGDLNGNAATATRINGNLAQATSDANRNIWVSSTASADGIPNYVTTFTMNPSTKTLHIPSGGRIDANGGALYLGNSNNANWVYVQDIASQSGTDKWAIHQTNGNAEFYGTITAGSISAHGIWANRVDGEKQVGVDNGTAGNLYLWSNASNKGLYSGSGYKTGAIITINSAGRYFYPNQILIDTSISSAATSQPTALSYGRLQAYGTLCINANTDNSGTEYVILTAGHGCSSSTAEGFWVGSGSIGSAYNMTISQNTYPSLTLSRSDAGETTMYFKNNTAGWAIGINPWSVGAGQFAIGQYSGTGSSAWRFKIDNNGYCFTRSYLNLGAGNEKNASSPPYVLGFNSSDTYIRSYQTGYLSVSNAGYLRDKTNGTASYLNYGRSGITSASSYTWLCAWEGYNVVPVSKGSIYESVRDGGGDSRWYVKGADNNHVTHTNEFNFVGSGFSGIVYFNWRTSGGGNGSISQYVFSTGNGSSTSRAGISCGSLGCSSLSCSSITGTSATLHIYNGNGARLSLQSDNNLVWYRKDGSVVWSSGTSSYRTKQNIRSIDEYELSNFMKIHTVSFKYRPEMHFADTDKQYGVIAEELLSSYPNLVYIPEEYVDSKFDVKKGMEQPLIRVKYEQFIPLLIKMVQKQQKEIEELRKQIKCD